MPKFEAFVDCQPAIPSGEINHKNIIKIVESQCLMPVILATQEVEIRRAG
jgi:hypothetical protein